MAIFEVWQNALADIPNPTSRMLLQQCATWLTTIDAIHASDIPDDHYAYWQNVSELDEFQKSLGQLLLRSSRAEPSLAFDYLQRATNSERIRDNAFHDIVAYSPILAQSLPKSLVDLSLAYLIKELPDDRVARKREESRKHAEWRKATLAKPEEERTQRDKMILSSNFHPLAFDDFSYHEWERLSIHDDYRYFPSSPLRQPFHALFQSAPEEG